MLDQGAVCSRCWDHHAGQLHFVQTIFYFLFIQEKLLPWLNASHTDSTRNWNPERRWLPQVLRWTASISANVKPRRGFAAILCPRGRNTCSSLQQQGQHLLVKTARMSRSSRNWNPDLMSWLMPEDEQCMQDLQLLKWYMNPLLASCKHNPHACLLFSS